MNIIDYLKMRSDISFDYDPFNEVDNLCLSQCAYAHLEKVIKNIDKAYSLKEASDLLWKDLTDKDILKSKSFVANSAFVLRELANTKRFKDVKLHHFVATLDKKTDQQFSAMQFDIDKDLTYVAFRGTDSTIIGWKEDFKISYEITKAQEAAVNYLNKYCDLKRKYIIGGHSKGGNLAVYGALKANKKLQDRIIKIYSNDGPGLNKELLNDVDYGFLYKKAIKIVPEYDVFGTIYDDPKVKHLVVKSNADFILQHSATSWLVLANSFEKAKKITPESEVIKKALNEFMLNVDMEHRKLFFEEFFVAVDELKLANVYDINKVTILAAFKSLTKIIAMDDDSKKVALKFTDVIKDLVKYETDEIKDKISEMIQDSMRQVNKQVTKVRKHIKNA